MKKKRARETELSPDEDEALPFSNVDQVDKAVSKNGFSPAGCSLILSWASLDGNYSTPLLTRYFGFVFLLVCYSIMQLDGS